MERQDASETSPLLPKTAVPASADSINEIQSSTVVSNGQAKNDGKLTDDGESQKSGGQAAQHEGMPEIKAKLKYILPAIGIGVCRYLKASQHEAD